MGIFLGDYSSLTLKLGLTGLYAIHAYMRHTTFSLDVTSDMSLGHRFCASRKGGTGGGGWVSTVGPGNMASSGLSCRKPLIGTG